MSTSYGVVPVSLNAPAKVTIANQGISCAIVANESPYTLNCKVDGTASTKWIHALTVDRVDIPQTPGFSGNLIFEPQEIVNIVDAPSYAVVVETYGINEPSPGNYPIALSRAVVIGNSIPVSTSVDKIINDNQAPGATLIEATPSDASSSTWQADNAGNLTIKVDNAGVLTQVLQILAGAAPALNLGDINIRLEVIGDLRVQTGAIYGVDPTNSIIVSTGTGGGQNTRVQSGGSINLQAPAGTTRAFVDSSGFHVINGALLLQAGSATRWGDTAGTGTGTFSHNLGAVPHFVSITTHAVGSQTVGFDSETSTQVHVTAAAGLAWFAWLLRR